MMGECNCARMPVLNPFGRVGLLLSAFPVFRSIVSFSSFDFSSSVFPETTLFLAFLWFNFLCCDYGVVCVCVCVCFFFLSFRFCSWTYFSVLKCLSFCGSFVCEILCSFFQNDAALLLDSRSANANAEWNNKCVYSQCSCHLVYSDPLLKKLDLIGPDWVPWWFQAAIKGCHLQCRVDQ